MIQGFFFDMDGTLVDTHRANFLAYQKALKGSGVSIDFDDFKKTIGHGAKEFLPWLAPDLKTEDYADIAKRKAEYYKEFINITELNAKLVQFLDLISKDNQIVLVSTAKRANAMAVLRQHDLADYFDYIITGEDVEHLKPHPEAYQLALTKIGLEPSEVIAFEDSEVGRQSAEAAGIPVIMIKDFTP